MGASFVALLVNTALNFALIPRWGMYGAAYATLVAYVIEALVMYVLAQRTFRLEYDLPRTLAALGVFAMALSATRGSLEPFTTALRGRDCRICLPRDFGCSGPQVASRSCVSNSPLGIRPND